jgi:hypothetical protein
VAQPTAKIPQAQPAPTAPAQKSAAVINFPTTTTTATQPVPAAEPAVVTAPQAEPEYQITPQGAKQANQLDKQRADLYKKADRTNGPEVDSQVPLIRQGTDLGRGQQTKVDPAQAVTGPEPKEEPKKSNVIKGKFGDPSVMLDQPEPEKEKSYGTYGLEESVNKGKNMLKENIEMLTEYAEGSPQLALINWNTLLGAWKKRQPKVDLDFGGRPLTIWKEQMYALLSEFATDQNAERRMQRVEDVLASYNTTVEFMMLPRVKKFINQYPQFEKNDPVLKAAKEKQKQIAQQQQAGAPGFSKPPSDMFSGNSKLPVGSREEMQENVGNDTMQENIKTNSILEGVRQVEDKKLKEAAKPDFLDLDKDGDTDEPMKSAAKSAKDHEPAEVDSDAVAKRKRLQALKDKQEDERAEKDDDYKSASRVVKGRAYGGAAQKDDEDKDELDEVAPPGAKAERMVKHIKKGYAKDGKLSKKEKGIAYATAWKARNKGQVEEGTNFGDTIKNSEGKMTKVTVKEGKDAIRNHPIYTNEQAWKHYAEELAEQEMMEQSMMEAPVVDVQQELDEIAKLAGLAPKMENLDPMVPADSASPLTHTEEGMGCTMEELEEAASRKDFRRVADRIANMKDRDEAAKLGHAFADDFEQANPRFKRKMFLTACGLDEAACNMRPGPATIMVGEEAMDEGNEFTKARLDAIAQGKDTFSVSGKTYNVSGDTSDEKTQVESVNEDINVNITANGEQDALNLLRKLSGMAEVPQVTGIAIPMGDESATCGACGSSPCGCEESVEEERDIELANTPHETVAPINAVTTDAGGGLGGVKKQYPLAANRGANPLEEEKLWTAYENMINDVKA